MSDKRVQEILAQPLAELGFVGWGPAMDRQMFESGRLMFSYPHVMLWWQAGQRAQGVGYRGLPGGLGNAHVQS